MFVLCVLYSKDKRLKSGLSVFCEVQANAERTVGNLKIRDSVFCEVRPNAERRVGHLKVTEIVFYEIGTVVEKTANILNKIV